MATIQPWEGSYLTPSLETATVSDTDLLRAARTGIDGLTAGEMAGTEPVTVEPSLALTEAMSVVTCPPA
jgi:hypothetical protein